MVVVSSDGSDLEPEEADSLVTYAGERFDVIVQMDQDVDNYWIRFRGLMDCDERFTSAFQMAVLHYHGAVVGMPDGEPSYDNSIREGLVSWTLNNYLLTFEDERHDFSKWILKARDQNFQVFLI